MAEWLNKLGRDAGLNRIESLSLPILTYGAAASPVMYVISKVDFANHPIEYSILH